MQRDPAEVNAMFKAVGLFPRDDGVVLNQAGEASVAGNGIDDKSERACQAGEIGGVEGVCGNLVADMMSSY